MPGSSKVKYLGVSSPFLVTSTGYPQVTVLYPGLEHTNIKGEVNYIIKVHVCVKCTNNITWFPVRSFLRWCLMPRLFGKCDWQLEIWSLLRTLCSSVMFGSHKIAVHVHKWQGVNPLHQRALIELAIHKGSNCIVGQAWQWMCGMFYDQLVCKTHVFNL